MAKKIQFVISNIKFNDIKKIENYLKNEFTNLYRNFYTQKDKKHNISIYFSFKNDELEIQKLFNFFEKTYWKLCKI